MNIKRQGEYNVDAHIARLRWKNRELISEVDADSGLWYELFVDDETEGGTRTVHSGNTFDDVIAKFPEYVGLYGFHETETNIDIWCVGKGENLQHEKQLINDYVVGRRGPEFFGKAGREKLLWLLEDMGNKRTRYMCDKSEEALCGGVFITDIGTYMAFDNYTGQCYTEVFESFRKAAFFIRDNSAPVPKMISLC